MKRSPMLTRDRNHIVKIGHYTKRNSQIQCSLNKNVQALAREIEKYCSKVYTDHKVTQPSKEK